MLDPLYLLNGLKHVAHLTWNFCSGIVATVFGATGFLGRYVVQQLGELTKRAASETVYVK